MDPGHHPKLICSSPRRTKFHREICSQSFQLCYYTAFYCFITNSFKLLWPKVKQINKYQHWMTRERWPHLTHTGEESEWTDPRGGPRCCGTCSGPPQRWAQQTPAWQRCSPSPPPPQLSSSSLLSITGTPGGRRQEGVTICCSNSISEIVFLRGEQTFIPYFFFLQGKKILWIPVWESLLFHNQLVMKRRTLQFNSPKHNNMEPRTHQSERARAGASCSATMRPLSVFEDAPVPSRRVLSIRERGALRGPGRIHPWLRTGAPVASVLSATRLVDHIFWCLASVQRRIGSQEVNPRRAAAHIVHVTVKVRFHGKSCGP